ncbi:MAG TPA: arginyltransferase [Thiohalobacter sp.]|nr:arginyltransferase [Thiohalobacter sp.]
MNRPTDIQLYATPPQQCSYLPDREAVSIFVEPGAADNPIYSHLIRHGFRRSGEHIYRPACPGCQACVSVRIPVAHFTPSRRDRRCRKRNQDLVGHWLKGHYAPEYFELYQRYLAARHPGGGMDKTSPSQFRQFLLSRWSQTLFLELRQDEQLMAVACTDLVDDGLSAVYTFFEPGAEPRGLGNYAILQQIDLARRLHLDWVYLGYWIENSPKMAYKRRFRPLQGYQGDRWRTLAEEP